MCWVMPPASPAATSVSRIASSSEVLPWSTWPMIVTTGGRSTRSSSASSNTGSTSTSSAAWTISICLSNSSASTWIGVVGERLRERRHLAEHHQLLDHLGDRHAEVLGDVLDRGAGVDADQVRRLHRGGVDRGDRLVVGAAPAASAARAALGLVGRAALLAAGGLGVDHHAAASARADVAGRALARARVARGAHALGGGRRCAGRRRRPRARPLSARGRRERERWRRARAPRRARLGRCPQPASRGRRRGAPAACPSAPGRRGGGRAVGARRRGAGAIAEHLQRRVLLDGGGGGLGVDAGSLQLLQQLLAGETVLLGDFVYALFAHDGLNDSTSSRSTVTAARRARAIPPRCRARCRQSPLASGRWLEPPHGRDTRRVRASCPRRRAPRACPGPRAWARPRCG